MKDLGDQSQSGTVCASEYFPFALGSNTGLPFICIILSIYFGCALSSGY